MKNHAKAIDQWSEFECEQKDLNWIPIDPEGFAAWFLQEHMPNITSFFISFSRPKNRRLVFYKKGKTAVMCVMNRLGTGVAESSGYGCGFRSFPLSTYSALFSPCLVFAILDIYCKFHHLIRSMYLGRRVVTTRGRQLVLATQVFVPSLARVLSHFCLSSELVPHNVALGLRLTLIGFKKKATADMLFDCLRWSTSRYDQLGTR
jgi:hypothetical protein